MGEALTLEQLRTQYRDRILSLAEEHGAKDVRVFGSVARGDAHERSDIDFLVRLNSGAGLWEMGGLHTELSDLLNQDIDLVPEEWLDARDRPGILAEAQPL